MTTTRRIPITVAPLPGEALDSWLEAIAHRTHTCWADLLDAVGLSPAGVTRTLPNWMVNPTTEQCVALNAATGVEASTIAAMTLAHYEGKALATNDTGHALDQTFPWGPRPGSHYCPHCLAESGGRWLLSWRLSWTFACLRHRCLLAESCSSCGSRPRARARRGLLVPQPRHCAAPATRAPTSPQCGADLADAAVPIFDDDDHPVLQAQRWINRVLAADRVPAGIYRDRRESSREILRCVRMIGVKALTYATPAELEPMVPADVLTVYQQDHPALPTATRYDYSNELTIGAPRQPSLTAVGVLAALDCLNQPDIQLAGKAVRWLLDAMRARGARPSTINLLWPDGVPRAVHLAALGPGLKPSEQLRYRLVTPWPSSPTGRSAEVREFARKIPTALWHNHALLLAVPGSHQRQLRPALAVALLLVGTTVTLATAVRMLGSPVDEHGVSRILQLLHRHPAWLDISAAITALADDLADTEVPIDYHRRRSMDYGTLLPDDAWLRICRQTDTAAQGPARASVARHYMQERVSGSLVGSDVVSPDLRTKICDFPYYLTPELADALDAHAKAFLADHGTGEEPVCYQHPAGARPGLALPGINPDTADIDELHHHVRAGLPLGRAATAAGIDLDVARYLLACYPTPVHLTDEPGAYYRARNAYPRQKFIDLYKTERKSLRDIAVDAGVSKQTMARLAADYQIDLRKPGRATKHDIDRDWLYTEYITHGRPLPELAREQGVGTTTVARWAKNYGIPLRPRGGTRNTENAGEGAEAG